MKRSRQVHMSNKRAQFGPDSLVAIVVIGLIGLGGVFFIDLFINGFTMQGLLKILDTEIDQRCFYMLLPIVGDEYVKAGENVTGNPRLRLIQNYYVGENAYSYRSMELENKLEQYRTALVNGEVTFAKNFTYISGFLASDAVAAKMRTQIYTTQRNITSACTIPAYSPVGLSGSAELYMKTG